MVGHLEVTMSCTFNQFIAIDNKHFGLFLWSLYRTYLGHSIIASLAHISHLTTKPTKWHVHPAKTQISLGIRPVWSESSLSAWRNLRPLPTHWAHSEVSDQTGRMPRLIQVFAGRTLTLLVLSCRSSYMENYPQIITFNLFYWTLWSHVTQQYSVENLF